MTELQESFLTLGIVILIICLVIYGIKKGFSKLLYCGNRHQQANLRNKVPGMIDKVMSHITDDASNNITSSPELKVAGITHHHLKYSNAGILIGYAEPEPDNKHDIHAIVLRDYNNRTIGYISRDEQHAFHEFADNSTVLPFVSEVSHFTDDHNHTGVMARIILFKGNKQLIENSLKRFYDERPSAKIL